MTRCFVFMVLLLGCGLSQAQESGTIVLSSKTGLVGRIAKRISGGDHYTHVGIVIDGYVYESDWPRAKKTPVSQYGKRGSTNDYYAPTKSLDVDTMRQKAESMLGTRYSLRSYFHPDRKSNGTWCSPFSGEVLNAGGCNLTPAQYHEPQNIYETLRSEYNFESRVVRQK
jgi:hypothetical protein